MLFVYIIIALNKVFRFQLSSKNKNENTVRVSLGPEYATVVYVLAYTIGSYYLRGRNAVSFR